jgi:glycosyltransferase involved in cell wall biosynthesis
MQASRFPSLPITPLTLSVVMAVYDEAETVGVAIDRVLGVDIPGVRIELVVVESNSSDGTRSIVLRYAADPRVRLVLQDTPRGKGAAVREGFTHATGDVILIQDADLEYSVEDYPKLIEPIIHGDVDFTLGSRHAPGRSVRVMDEARLVAPIMNTAHWVFTWFFNVTYRTKLRDPFTMYKVFRRECIEGVEFVADRFDFDWELVAKLVRLGYEPIEIPVQYEARSFHRGKKVRFFRDPPTWVAACVRFRFCSLPAQRRDPRIASARNEPDPAGRSKGDTVSDWASDSREARDPESAHERA